MGHTSMHLRKEKIPYKSTFFKNCTRSVSEEGDVSHFHHILNRFKRKFVHNFSSKIPTAAIYQKLPKVCCYIMKGTTTTIILPQSAGRGEEGGGVHPGWWWSGSHMLVVC